MEATLNVEENDVLKQFMELLGQQGMGGQAKDFLELCRYVAGMQIQLTVMTGELQGVREQLSKLQENQPRTVRYRLAERVEHFQGKITDTSNRLSETRNRLIGIAAQAVRTFLGKGKAAMCKVIRKMILPVKKMLEGCRKQMAYAMADCQKTVNWMNSIGSEVKQIENGVSNLGRLLSGKDVKEIQGEKPGIGATRAISGVFKNIMAKLQKNINLVGKALNSLDKLSKRLENTIAEAEKGARASVREKLSQTKSKTDQHKEAPEQVKGKEMCM